jgi:hypothetical protein
MAKKIVAVKTPPAPPKPSAKKAVAKKALLSVLIDHPLEGETVRPGHYSLRLTAAGASSVQARFDGGDWLDCREAVGHFWLDWSPRAGAARLEARARSGQGRWTVAPARVVVVAG